MAESSSTMINANPVAAESKDTTTVAILGVGGYGRIYVTPLLDASAARRGVRLIAAVEPNPGAGVSLSELKDHGIPVYATTAELYARHRPDVVVIASPIQFHCQQTIEALGHGSHVLCEKPLCATADQARQMRDAERAAGRQVAVGYQWSFSDAIGRLKADILAGKLGQIRRCKSLTLWPRDEAYYGRNNWAGRRLAPSGLPVNDSPINNACAHFLHNLLYLLGSSPETSVTPESVTAELYRANPIETFDTAALRARLPGGAELLMIAAHATHEVREPVFELQFDKATVKYDAGHGGRLAARFRNGATHDYGEPSSSVDADKLWSSIRAFNQGEAVACGIDAALPQALVVAAADRSTPSPHAFPADLLRVSGIAGHRLTSVVGLCDVLTDCYENWALPSELGVAWAKAGADVAIVAAADATPATPENVAAVPAGGVASPQLTAAYGR